MLESSGRIERIGNARWMLPNEVEARFAFQDGDFWLGRNPFEGENPIGFSDDRHIMLVAGSRGGKGAGIIVPNLALWPGSIVTIDPKGENANLLAARRGGGSEYCDGLGQSVYVLDPMNTAHVDGSYRAAFNPLDAIDPRSPDALDDAGRIADALVEIGEGESRFWDESARALIKTLILHVLTEPDPRFDGKRTLLTVRRLLLSGDKEMVEAMRKRGSENVPSPHVMLWEIISRNQAMGGAIASAADSMLEIAKHSPKQYNSIRGVADRNTEFLDSPGMAACLSRSDFQLSELKTVPKGVSVFLSLPDHAMNTHYRWLRMMSALIITEMQKSRGQPASGHRVLMCLDEFAGLRRMEVIERAVAQISGFGMKLFFVLQSLEQLKGTYPERWETFLANCGVRVFFACTDNFTNEYVSKALGEIELIRETENYSEQLTETENRSSSRGGGTTHQRSTSETESTSRTTTRGGGTSRSTGGGTNQGTGGGTNQGIGGGTSQSRGASRGTSHGESFGPGFFFGPWRTGSQHGQNQGESWQSGANQNWSQGSQQNWSRGSQRNWSRGSQRNWSTSYQKGRSHSRTEGVSKSETWQDTSGHSTAKGETRGRGQQIFKKPLVTPDEMATLFRRVDEKDHPAYPGLALISVAGEPPVLLRKTNYYEDHAFVRCFDPHLDHPFIPYEPPEQVEEADTARIKIPERSFAHSVPQTHEEKQQLKTSIEILQKWREFRYDAIRIFPFKLADVWRILTYSETWHAWLGANFTDGALLGLPQQFGAGSFIRPSNHDLDNEMACVINGENRSTLAIRWYNTKDEKLFYFFDLHTYSRTETKVSLSTRYYHKGQDGIITKALERMFPEKFKEDDDHKKYFEQISALKLKKFEYECYDLLNYGRSIQSEKGRSLHWFVWHYCDGILRIHPDDNGSELINIGTILEKDDNVGYIYNPNKHESEDYAKQNYYIEIPRPCIVRDIARNHGDHLETYDRLFLLEWID